MRIEDHRAFSSDEISSEETGPKEGFLSQTPSAKSFVPGFLYTALAACASLLALQSDSWKEVLIGNPVTSLLVHADIRHFLSNMIFFIPFAGLLRFYFGWLMFPLLAIILGVATRVISLETYPSNVTLIGSSGVLYVLFGLWLSLYYKAESHLPRRKRWLRLLGFGLVMLVPSQFSPTVSYRSHYIGLFLGLFAGIVYAWLNRKEIELRNKVID